MTKPRTPVWPGPAPAALGLALASWPRSRGSLVLGLLAEGLGIGLTATTGELVEYEDFPVGAIWRFEAAVAQGTATDSDPGFRQFASTDFSGFDAFRIRWTAPRQGRLVVPLAGLRAEPGAFLPAILAMLAPALAKDLNADADAADLLAARAQAWLTSHRAPDPQDFSHYDPELFDRLAKLRLRRDVVTETFGEVMGRPLDERSITHFQTMASRDVLVSTLISSKEYRAREEARWTGVPASDLPPALIHLHIPKSAGTSLNTILADQFGVGERMALNAGETSKLDKLTPGQRARIRLIFGHLPYGVGHGLTQRKIYLVALRQPGPRILSYFRYMKRREDHPMYPVLNADDMSFGSFLEYCAGHPNQRIEVDNGQMRRIAGDLGTEGLGEERTLFRTALAHLFGPEMLFGLTERFEEFLTDLVARGLIPAYTTMVANADPERVSFAQTRAGLTDRQRELLDSYTIWDQKLYDICEACLFDPDHAQPDTTS